MSCGQDKRLRALPLYARRSGGGNYCNVRAVCGWMQARSFQIGISLLAAYAYLSVIDADVPRYRYLRR
jgi:hypothetical protein